MALWLEDETESEEKQHAEPSWKHSSIIIFEKVNDTLKSDQHLINKNATNDLSTLSSLQARGIHGGASGLVQGFKSTNQSKGKLKTGEITCDY